ncbi:hypothetical protein NBRC10512_006608 [Rhodotorula toruloides]|uniref:RHTO0S10e04852g1_1 n=2 Tax=Rhodotorula toruloides TaxID=5286 RepID=A0A061B6S3_RHOTO|nr:mitochondrial carrier protein [Rhodotorula toruloides NP11]EMS22787.1 mitochondrial carrier protein [Rhodotorula toruloides NP11]CDR45076.1 RHTO0S10e04852g1_1 [Rhodotorula toruloides]
MSPQQSNGLSPVNLAIGAGVSVFEVTTLGQPFEVLKTHMAANRHDSLREAIRKTTARGGIRGFYQGLIPWAWIESSTAGGILLFTSSYVESFTMGHGIKPGAAGLLGGIIGGAAQAYLSMGVCTRMKTAEITRQKIAAVSSVPGQPAPQAPSTMGVFMDMWRKEGIRGINKGVNAVALRQATNWGSRIGVARAAEQAIKEFKGKKKSDALSPGEKVIASAVGGALGCWNHPIEVIRVEMQSLVSPSAKSAATASSTARPQNPTILSTAKYIYQESGIRGLFRGVSPRIALSVWRTVCLVSLGDHVKEMVKKDVAASVPE